MFKAWLFLLENLLLTMLIKKQAYQGTYSTDASCLARQVHGEGHILPWHTYPTTSIGAFEPFAWWTVAISRPPSRPKVDEKLVCSLSSRLQGRLPVLVFSFQVCSARKQQFQERIHSPLERRNATPFDPAAEAWRKSGLSVDLEYWRDRFLSEFE